MVGPLVSLFSLECSPLYLAVKFGWARFRDHTSERRKNDLRATNALQTRDLSKNVPGESLARLAMLLKV